MLHSRCELPGGVQLRARYCHELASHTCANATVVRLTGERVRCAYDDARKKCRLAARHTATAAAPVVLLHVPKTAGTTLRYELVRSGLAPEMEKRKPWSTTVQHANASLAAEACFRTVYRGAGRATHVALLRSPRDHVLSQYYECRDAKWGQLVSPAFPRKNASFEAWVTRFAALGARTIGCAGDFGC